MQSLLNPVYANEINSRRAELARTHRDQARARFGRRRRARGAAVAR